MSAGNNGLNFRRPSPSCSDISSLSLVQTPTTPANINTATTLIRDVYRVRRRMGRGGGIDDLQEQGSGAVDAEKQTAKSPRDTRPLERYRFWVRGLQAPLTLFGLAADSFALRVEEEDAGVRFSDVLQFQACYPSPPSPSPSRSLP